MSEWITDRPPTEEDADDEKSVWTMCVGKVVTWGYEGIRKGQPWMPTNRPEPYVKPKRWTAVWYASVGSWALRDNVKGAYIPLFHSPETGLVNNDDEHREAAERIAAIYEEMMP